MFHVACARRFFGSMGKNMLQKNEALRPENSSISIIAPLV
jgi:hypothetical protein